MKTFIRKWEGNWTHSQGIRNIGTPNEKSQADYDL